MPIPQSRIPVPKGQVRFSHVAHFVGLSLLKDPNLPRAVVKSASSPQVGAVAQGSQLQSSSSSPNLSVERVDKLRTQMSWLKAERRAELEQLKKLEHSLNQSMQNEAKAHARANRQREVRHKTEEQLYHVKHQMGELKQHMAHEKQRQLASTWPADGQLSLGAAASAEGTAPQQLERSIVPQNDADRAASAPAAEANQQVVEATKQPRNLQVSVDSPPTVDMFDNEHELACYRREAVRKEMISKAAKRSDPSEQILEGRPVSYFEMKRALIEHKLSDRELQQIWSELDIVEEGNVIEAFRLINLSGSGRICSQEFADGVARVGVHWQKLTGLKNPKHLFRLFDQDKDGVITLYELFPTERNRKRDDGGATTPEFWKNWVRKNPAHQFESDNPKGRPTPWHTGKADDGYAILKEREAKDAEAAFMRKWMHTTMRRMKGNGKSIARCREMCCSHLPRGTGPPERQGVNTFSDNEVKQCRRMYQDAVMEPQRTVQKALYDLRETRKELSTSRQKLWTVSMEPMLRQQALEDQAKIAKSALGGLSLGLHKPEEEPEPPKPPHVDEEIAEDMRDMTPFD